MAAAPNPLDQLFDAIASARDLPPPPAYQPSDDPIAALRSRWSSQPGAEESTPRPSTSGADSAPSSGLDTLVGSEVLRLVAERPLSPAARAEAVRRAALAATNPTPQNVRAILAVLLADRPDA